MANASSRGAHVARGQARGVPTFDETRSEQRIIIQHRAREVDAHSQNGRLAALLAIAQFCMLSKSICSGAMRQGSQLPCVTLSEDPRYSVWRETLSARVLVCIGGGQEQSRDRRRTLITGAAAFVRKQLPLQLTGRSDVVTVSRETRGSHARNAPPLREGAYQLAFYRARCRVSDSDQLTGPSESRRRASRGKRR
ncbi:unnamed protein product [Lampetra fluviatilis]